MHKKPWLNQQEKITLGTMIVILMLVAFIYYLKNRPLEIINYPTERELIVAFGDSLVAGVGSAADGEGFVDDLEALLNVDIVNLGKSGDTTTDGLMRIEQVLDRNPALVIISLGGNDYLQRAPAEQVRQNFNKIISQIQNNGSMVMILGVPGYRGLHESLADSHDAAYVSNILGGLIGRDQYMADAIHPNDEGYAKIAGRVAPVVKKLFN